MSAKLKPGMGAGKSMVSLAEFPKGKRLTKTIECTEECLAFLQTLHPNPNEALQILLDNDQARERLEIRGSKRRPLLALKGGKQ